MMLSASPRPAAASARAASRTTWQASLVERALRALAADYRRPTGPVVIAAVLACTAVLTAASPHDGRLLPAGAVLLALLATVPIAVIRRLPATAITIVLSASAVFLVAGRLAWPPTAIAGWLIAVAACPVMLSRKAAIRAFVLTEAVVLLAALPAAPSITPWDATFAEGLAVIAAWGAGETLRSRRQSALHQAEAAEQLRYLSERDVVARERASIARELHDVVAHHVSMIAVRAGTAPYAISDLPEPGREAFGEIAQEARIALTELRVVLGVLRDPGRVSEAAPQPRICDVAALLARARGAGTEVREVMTGTVRSLPSSVELCAYRIVQEAVTNAGRHAPGSQVSVSISYQRADLVVIVRNSAPDAARPGQREPQASTGYGLVGLRERVAMLGGTITAGTAGEGGFAVWALLPAPPDASPPDAAPPDAAPPDASPPDASPPDAGPLDGALPGTAPPAAASSGTAVPPEAAA